ncbi:MAG: LmeA family phospholipid-binding protein [Actinomycetes bacterium]
MRKLWIGIIGSLLMLVVLDFLAKAIVEGRVAEAVQTRYDLTTEPDVDIHGFPFLLEAATRRLDRVDVHADSVQVANVELAEAELRMHDVRVESTSSAVAETVDAEAVVPYSELAELAEEVGRGSVTLSYGGAPDTLAVSGTVSVLGQDFDVVAYTQVRVDESTLTLRTTRVEINGQPAPEQLVQAIGNQFDLTFRIPEMFDLVRLTGVEMRPDGVAVGLTGSDIALG